MSNLNDQRAMATALFAAAAEVAREISAEARARQVRRRPNPKPQPIQTLDVQDIPDDYVPDTCTCMTSRNPPCSWCTSDDNPLNIEAAR